MMTWEQIERLASNLRTEYHTHDAPDDVWIKLAIIATAFVNGTGYQPDTSTPGRCTAEKTRVERGTKADT